MALSRWLLALLAVAGCATPKSTPTIRNLVTGQPMSLMEFCQGVERITKKWPTRPTKEQLELDHYFPVATITQQRDAGYPAGARPGLPAFLSDSCLDWAYQTLP